MKLLVLLALSITISTVYSSGTRRSDNNPPTDAGKERDTPFWAPRGKKNSLADSVRCGYLRQFEDTDDEPNWMELDSSERFYDKNLEPWNSRLKRSLALGGLPSLDNEVRRRLWLLKSYMDPNGNKLNSEKNLDLLSAWLKVAEKRKSGNSGNTNTNTDANNVPFWAARG